MITLVMACPWRKTVRPSNSLMGSYWTGADILVQHLGKKEGGLDKLKGKKNRAGLSRLAVRKEPIPVLQSAPRCMADLQ
jgi:hypothetical protein